LSQGLLFTTSRSLSSKTISDFKSFVSDWREPKFPFSTVFDSSCRYFTFGRVYKYNSGSHLEGAFWETYPASGLRRLMWCCNFSLLKYCKIKGWTRSIFWNRNLECFCKSKWSPNRWYLRITQWKWITRNCPVFKIWHHTTIYGF